MLFRSYKDIDFDENVIPHDKLRVINAIKYGTNSKIFIPFDSTSHKTLGLVSDQIYGNYDNLRGILTMNFTDQINKDSEDKFTNIHAITKPMIEEIFNASFAVPLCVKDQSFAVYNQPIGYSWLNDPYVKGSYSYISPGQENALTSITEVEGEKSKSLFAPIQGLYFAGEHASISEIHGTMEAACESGERSARMIFKHLKYMND